MFLSDLSIKRPVFTAMVIVALMTLGLLAVKDIGVDLFPDISFPIVTIATAYPGAGPAEIEQQVTKPIEEAVSSINGVETVRSYSRDSISTIVVQFKLDADIKSAGQDVRDKLSLIRSTLPLDIRDPVIGRVDVTAVPVVTYAVSSKRDPAETRRIAEDVIKPKLEAVDGVAAVNVSGGLEREIQIQVDRLKLEGLNLSLAQLAQQLSAEGLDIPAGRVTSGAFETNVKADGRFRSVEEIRDVVVAALPSGAQVRLADVATVADTYKDVRTLTRLNGVDAVTLEVQKQGGTNTVAIADKVIAVVAGLGETLPKDFHLVKVIDSSPFIRRNIEGVTRDLLFGGLMAVLVVFLFMLDWRSTLITSLSLPTSVITTFLMMKWMGFTFNLLSLLGLSLSIGLLIDDAVVVRENIFRHMHMGKDPITAAREGTAEIGLAVMATTFTIVAVFVPVGFMGGIVGRMFRQFGLTVTAAVLVSLFVSFTLDPMMSARVMKPVAKDSHDALRHHWAAGPIVRFYDWLDGYYRGLLRWALDHKKAVIAVVAVAFFASLSLTKYMGKEFTSPEDRGEFKLTLELPAGTSLGETSRVATQVEALAREASPEVKSIFAIIGPSEEANKANLRVITTKRKERALTQWDIEDLIRRKLSSVPGLKYYLGDIGLIEGTGNDYPITLYVRGDDYEQLQVVARRTLALLKSIPGAVDADMSFRAGKPETSIHVDRAKAADLGVSAASVAQTARTALEGTVVAKYRDGDRENDVRLFLDPASRANAAVLGELTVPASGRRLGTLPSMNTRLVRISEVATVDDGSGPGTIERMDRQRQIILTSGVKDRSLGEVVADLTAGIEKLKANGQVPAGVTFAFDGQAKNMKETFANMGLALATAVLFIFFVLASQFESLIHPFTIMLALPLAIVGALLGLFLTGASIGMPSMIGIILLMGLVTKNAILLVDYTNELREKGRSMVDALLEAGPTRLRPILMTSAAMVLGMMPGALSTEEGSEFKTPMARAVIGGVIASTFLTLLVVPIVYTWLDRFTSRGRAEAKARAKVPRIAPAPPSEEPAPLAVPMLRQAEER